MKFQSQFITLVLMTASLAACASGKNNKELNEKVAQESSVDSRTELNAEVKQVVDQNSNLTPQQKARLESIRSEMLAKDSELSKEALQLRSVLVKDIASQKEHVNEIKLIKARLREISTKRLDILFASIDNANLALGKFAAQHEKEMQETLKEDRMGRLEH